MGLTLPGGFSPTNLLKSGFGTVTPGTRNDYDVFGDVGDQQRLNPDRLPDVASGGYNFSDNNSILNQPANGAVLGASGAYSGGGSGGTTAAQQAAQTQALYDAQLNNLRDLLGRTDTGLNQGLSSLNDQYTSNVNKQTSAKNQAIQDYDEQRVQTTKDKQEGYNKAGRNANNAYRSLAQIIGRASGTGSSAFQELLPDVVGKDLSEKRGDVNTTYGENIRGLKKAQDSTELSFSNILADLAQQRQKGEQDLRTGVEGQRQSLLGQQQQLEAQRGNAAGVNALQGQIQNSRGSVENFFNQFKPQITAQQAAIATPELSQYTVDRSNVNAGATPGQDVANPYSDILRKRLQEGGL